MIPPAEIKYRGDGVRNRVCGGDGLAEDERRVVRHPKSTDGFEETAEW